MFEPFPMLFSHGHRVLSVRVTELADLPAALAVVGLPPSRPVLVLIGGAAGLETEQGAILRLRGLFRALAHVAEEAGAAVLDGGTDAGVMRLMGQARAEIDGTFSLLGVAAEGTVILPTAQERVSLLRECHDDRSVLEPNHTHFVLVPGNQWGDESPWLAAVAKILAGDAPSVTLLVNGGEISRQDVTRSLDAGRPVVVVAGTGRLADELASASERLALLHVVDLAAGVRAVVAVVTSLLTEGQGGQVRGVQALC